MVTKDGPRALAISSKTTVKEFKTEEDTNKWLKANGDKYDVIDIKFASAMGSFRALVIFNPKDEGQTPAKRENPGSSSPDVLRGAKAGPQGNGIISAPGGER